MFDRPANDPDTVWHAASGAAAAPAPWAAVEREGEPAAAAGGQGVGNRQQRLVGLAAAKRRQPARHAGTRGRRHVQSKATPCAPPRPR